MPKLTGVNERSYIKSPKQGAVIIARRFNLDFASDVIKRKFCRNILMDRLRLRSHGGLSLNHARSGRLRGNFSRRSMPVFMMGRVICFCEIFEKLSYVRYICRSFCLLHTFAFIWV